MCLNEIHLFGVLFGGWIGLSESWDYFFTERRLIKIPHIQQNIKVVVWSNMPSLLKTSLLVSAKRYLAYIILYLFFGGNIRNYVLSVIQLGTDEPLDSIFGLINVSLALRCIAIGSTCIFTFRLSNLLFQWFLLKVCITKQLLIKYFLLVKTFHVYIFSRFHFQLFDWEEIHLHSYLKL